LGLHIGPGHDLALPGMATVCADQVVDLTASEEQMFARLDTNFRNAIRQADKHELQLDDQRRTLSEDTIAEYYELAQTSARRTGEDLAPIEYYRCIYEAFHASRRCAVLFARHGGRAVAALLLLIDKQSAQFFAGVSHHEYLSMRVNNFIQWKAMQWLRSQGIKWYRLGPVFPELPDDWPVSRVSWFKGRLGGQSRTIIQGSLFRKPERYREDALEVVRRICSPKSLAEEKISFPTCKTTDLNGLARILRPYGLLPAPELLEVPGKANWTCSAWSRSGNEGGLLVVGPSGSRSLEGVDLRVESGRRLLRRAEGRFWFASRKPVYHALLPHVSFRGANVQPIWQTDEGRAVVAWRHTAQGRELLIGLNAVEEIVRHTHGDPAQLHSSADKSRWGYAHERPNYLYEEQLVPGMRTIPWADHLGFTLAELLGELTGLPLIEPLPHGAKGAILLTGDDDEAWLEKYGEQLDLVGDCPISYFLLDRTLHTPATLAKLPSNVELGLHVDALDAPEKYFERCQQQAAAVRRLCGRPVRTVRNHGFLSQGCGGHLDAWEAAGIKLDVNYPGMDGTALTASFLPFANRRPNGTWTNHYSLLTAFGDGMIFALKWSQRQAVAKIRDLCRQIEKSSPGIVCANFHPQNVTEADELHKEVLRWGRRHGWTALGTESLLDWWEARSQITVKPTEGGAIVHVPTGLRGVVARWPTAKGWKYATLPGTAGSCYLPRPGAVRCAS
jgi:hypothetical protein